MSTTERHFTVSVVCLIVECTKYSVRVTKKNIQIVVGRLGLKWIERSVLEALSKPCKREGGAGAQGAILPYVGHLQFISTLKIGADCCQLCQYKVTKRNQT